MSKALERVGTAALGYPQPGFGSSAAALVFTSVTNLAALTTLPVPSSGSNGLIAYVESVKDYFHLDLSSSLATSSPTVVATSLGGNTRWIRMNIPHPFWLTQTAWGIDATNGNDENIGSVASPLKTFAELARRWGTYGSITANTTVTLLTNLPTSDPISFKVELVGARLLISGTTTVIRSGSFTAVTARNAATNTPWAVTDAAMPGTWTDDLARRIRITSGAGINGIAFVAKDLGGKQARTSEFAVINLPPFVTGTFAVPGVGDTYNVEEVSSALLGDVDVRCVFTSATVQSNCTFNNITFSGTGGQIPILYAAGRVGFYGCRFVTGILVANTDQSFWMNNDFAGPWQVLSGFIYNDMGLARGFCRFIGGSVQLDGHFMSQGSGIGALGAVVRVSQVASFDSVISGFLNPSGAGFFISTANSNGFSYPNFVGQVVGNHASDILWGSGNAGPGIDVRTGTYVFITQPTITGSIDFGLGGSAVGFPFDPATGTYNSGAGLATTWANMPGALPGGFDNNAHAPARDCHLYKFV